MPSSLKAFVIPALLDCAQPHDSGLNFKLLTGTFYVNDKAKEYCKEYSAHLKVIVT